MIFELKNLTVSRIVEDLSLQLESGMTAFLNTYGEQEVRTLLQVLIGDMAPDSGTLLVDGTDLAQIGREAHFKARQTVGVITAQTNLISNLKVWENITLPLLYHYGTIPPEAADQAMHLLEQLGLQKSIWELPGHLSRVERIMVAFVRSVIASPRLLIYAACLDDLPGKQRETLLQLVVKIQCQSNAPAALFITAGDLQLPAFQPSFLCDLKQHPAQV
ncbi:ATP-binding cassette domain-containing protein, partial [bacterium]|nr:ATP-binding cassette domain-containing protein [bacterium]